MILFATVAKKCNPPHLSRGGLLLVEAIEVFRGEFERYRNMQQVHSAVPRRDVVCPDNWPARSKTCSESGRNKKIPSRISFSKSLNEDCTWDPESSFRKTSQVERVHHFQITKNCDVALAAGDPHGLPCDCGIGIRAVQGNEK